MDKFISYLSGVHNRKLLYSYTEYEAYMQIYVWELDTPYVFHILHSVTPSALTYLVIYVVDPESLICVNEEEPLTKKLLDALEAVSQSELGNLIRQAYTEYQLGVNHEH